MTHVTQPLVADATDDSVEAASPADDRQLQLEKLEAAQTTSREALLRAGFFSEQATLETYSGGRSNVTHHLVRYCVKNRSSRSYTFKWDKYNADIQAFSPVSRRIRSRRRVCPTCVTSHPAQYLTLLVTLLHRTRSSGLRFQRQFRGDDNSVDFAELLETLRDIEDLAGGVTRLAAAADADTATVIEAPLREVKAMVAACREAFSQQATSARSAVLDGDVAALLAAASAGAVSSAYALNPNRKGRTVDALVSHRSTSEVSLMRGIATMLFGAWVTFCRSNPDSDPGLWRPDGIVDGDIDTDWVTLEALSSIRTWETDPSTSADPWASVLANWKAVARSQANVLLEDWCAHYRWVRAAPKDTTTVVILDRRPEPMSSLGTLDRYDLLQRTLASFAPAPTEHPQLWVAAVPTLAARALDGYSAAGGAVQVASLEGFDTGRLDEALGIMLGFEDTFSGPTWFTSAAHATLSCLN
jgi:hypothetical protein